MKTQNWEKLDNLIDSVLEGIDQDEVSYKLGWWETSTGAEFGAMKKEELKMKLRTLLSQKEQEVKKEILDYLRLLKEQELPRACEDYSNDLDERIHFDDGYSNALQDLKQFLTPKI